MRQFPRFISKQMGRFVPGKTLFKKDAPVFLPFYHVVSDQELPHILNYNYRNTIQFEKELDFYLKYFEPVSLEYLLKNKKPAKKIFHLSFDDGLKECAEIIAPVLLKKGIQASFFVNTGFVDNKVLFHKYKASLILGKLGICSNFEAEKLLAENNLEGKKVLKAEISQVSVLDEVAKILEINFDRFLEIQKPYLTTRQILKLQKQGFTIGAHSFNHPEFWKISEEEQISQIRKSMEWINKTINPDIKTFAFPFTDFGVPLSVLETIKNENICDITFGTAGVKYDSFPGNFQRFPIEMPGDFVQNMKAEFVYFYLRKWIGKATVKH